MSKGAFSNEVSGNTGSGLPAAPAFVSKAIQGTVATLVYTLPTVTQEGEAIPAGGYSNLHVYADSKSFLGRIEDLLGLEPQVKVPVAVPAPGAPPQNITVVVPGLSPNTKYYFVACVE